MNILQKHIYSIWKRYIHHVWILTLKINGYVHKRHTTTNILFGQGILRCACWHQQQASAQIFHIVTRENNSVKCNKGVKKTK